MHVNYTTCTKSHIAYYYTIIVGIKLKKKIPARLLSFCFFIFFFIRFSARTIRHILYIRGRECIRPCSSTTDNLSPTALVHTAPPRNSCPVNQIYKKTQKIN